MAWFLKYATKTGENKILRIEEGATLRIGRGSTSDTKIEDTSMSRVHCEIEMTGSTPVLVDLGSASGTFVNRSKISERFALNSGQVFHAGSTKFEVVSDSPLDAPTRMIASKPIGADLISISDQLEIGSTLDRYILKKRVNESGQNLIFKAEDGESGSSVAVKIIPTGEASEEDIARFKRALGILQQVKSPNLVKMYRAGRKKNFCWVAMEWLEGGSLEDRAKKLGIKGCIDWKVVWRVSRSIANALVALEQAEVAHRNIKPTSILASSSEGEFVLADLIVAKAHDSSESKLVTRQLYLPKDLAYTAPERLLGSDTDECSLRSDLYSLGAVLSELLTGEAPFGHGALKDLLPKLKGSPRRVELKDQLGINEMFMDLVNRMTEPDPSKRVPSATKLLNEVQRIGKFAGLADMT